MERFVVSKELAEQLKAKGFPQKTQYAWWYSPLAKQDLLMRSEGINSHAHITAAPMTDELLDVLPKTVDDFYDLTIEVSQGFAVYYYDSDDNRVFKQNYIHDYKSLPNALARLWLWCKAAGHLE